MATLDELAKAHTRMLGRIDAANIEYRRAVGRYQRASGDDVRPAFEAQHRAGLVVDRRTLAGRRILAAMRRAIGS